MGWIIGVDEVGRGPLAGPVVTGGVLVEVPISGSWPVIGVKDSKKLTPDQRTVLARQIRGHSNVHTVIDSRDAWQIDRDGIKQSLGECFQLTVRRLLKRAGELGVKVRYVLVDGDPLWTPAYLTDRDDIPVTFIQQGDAKEWSIGAASIIAKVDRDRHMGDLAREYPGYGFEVNMGYGTGAHEDAIRRLGLTRVHRRTFCTKFINGALENSVFDLFEG